MPDNHEAEVIKTLGRVVLADDAMQFLETAEDVLQNVLAAVRGQIEAMEGNGAVSHPARMLFQEPT
jgi:hypothetical protein